MRLYLFLLIVLSTAIVSCNSAKHYYKQGNFDDAITQSVKKLRKKPDREKEIEILKKVYPLANSQNLDRIKFLQQEGNPGRWDEVYSLYKKLDDRQKLVHTIMPLRTSKGELNYPLQDYDKDIIAAKKSAAAFHYQRGKDLLKKNNRSDARKAYDDFIKVKSYYQVYEDNENMIKRALDMGTSHAMIVVKNNTIFKLPGDYYKSLIPEDLSPLNGGWVEYHANTSGQTFDYKVEIRLQKFLLSPAQIKEREFTESKEIKDGWEYLLDENGNVQKDSTGNDIKVTKYKTIKCVVTEVVQRREIQLLSEIVYSDLHSSKVLKKVPVTVGNYFENKYATANGDLDALSKETLQLLKNKSVPVPVDLDMIFNASQVLKDALRNALIANRKVLQ